MKNLKELLGPFPEKVPLDLRVYETNDFGSYIQKKIDFASESDDRIPAYLLLPKQTGKMPAVYCHHQHAGNWQLGKSEVVGLGGDPNMAYGRELAERGYIVLAPDAITFEERNKTNFSSAHNLYELTSRLIKKQTLFAKAMHDISVGFDLLESLPEVEATRLGFVGHSYGGRMAIWASALEQRIHASVSSCGCVSYEDSLDPNIGIQMEFCIPGIYGRFDSADAVRLHAPRALMILAADQDKWSAGAKRLQESCASAFLEGQFEVHIHPGSHVFTAAMREQAYGFFEKHLRSIGG